MDSPRTVKPEATAFPPELERLGIAAGARIDIRDLDALSKHHNFQAYLYFEEDLARGSTLGRDLEDYRRVPEVERPFVNLDEFLRFATASDPLFSSYLDELPLVIEILACGEIHAEDGEAVAYVKGLMPFLDELDVIWMMHFPVHPEKLNQNLFSRDVSPRLSGRALLSASAPRHRSLWSRRLHRGGRDGQT